jgi:2-keto-4-pentenoate hydratase/2-oxohepta-3-ene-1,7-dioic acid hydratase in catechol pathway
VRLLGRFADPAAGGAPAWGWIGDGAVTRLEAGVDGRPRVAGELALEGLHWLPPSAGGRIFGIGRNYAAHVAELNPGWQAAEPLVFLKPDTALIGTGEPIPLPAGAGRVDYEGEIAVVLGRGGRMIPPERALEHVLGCTCANDISAREWQAADGQWTRAKGCDGFCPLGPWIAVGAVAAELELRTWLDGTLVQSARGSEMSRGVPELIAWLSRFISLRPGDILLTGTPAGVGPLAPGNRVVVEIEGLGRLENPVVAAP